MSKPFKIAFSEDAKAAAEALSSLAAIEAQARHEIVEVFGDRFDLVRYFWAQDSTSVWHSFTPPGSDDFFAVYPHDAETWLVDICRKWQPEPMPAYQLVFTERAQACLRRYGWSNVFVEHHARRELSKVDPVDSGMCDFCLPVLQQKFRCWPLDRGRVEIDAIKADCRRYCESENVISFPGGD
jgi:hypothetical protein